MVKSWFLFGRSFAGTRCINKPSDFEVIQHDASLADQVSLRLFKHPKCPQGWRCIPDPPAWQSWQPPPSRGQGERALRQRRQFTSHFQALCACPPLNLPPTLPERLSQRTTAAVSQRYHGGITASQRCRSGITAASHSACQHPLVTFFSQVQHVPWHWSSLSIRVVLHARLVLAIRCCGGGCDCAVTVL